MAGEADTALGTNVSVEPRLTLQHKLRLFLSADIVGSTAFKQRSDGKSASWFSMVSSFYRQAEAISRTQWEWFSAKLKDEGREAMLGPHPELWKTVGDEVLFAKEVGDPSQAVLTMHVWMETLQELREMLQKKYDVLLDVKSTAWLADFPIRNREIVLGGDAASGEEDLDWSNDQLIQRYQSDPAGLTRDYIGPSIDTGFRLGAAATPRQLAISIELAHLLSGEECLARDKYKIGPWEMPPLLFRYDGGQPLKGVLDGASYPHIWIDTAPDRPINQAEDKLLGRPAPGCQDIHSFTSAFIEAHASKLCSGLKFLRSPEPVLYAAHCAKTQMEIQEREQLFRAVEASRQVRQASAEIREEDASASSHISVELPGLATSDVSAVTVAE